jgi:peptidylprolyl isomerase
MKRNRSRPAQARRLQIESLEDRIVLSSLAPAGGPRARTAEIAAQSSQGAHTTTTLAVTSGTLGTPIVITVTVRAPAAAGSPAGTINLTDHGTVIQTLPLLPGTSRSPRYAVSTAAITMTSQAGGPATFFGRHTVGATYVPSGTFAASSTSKSFMVTQPKYKTLPGGTKIATVIPGFGPQIQTGQTANVVYTGYLLKTGQIFDESMSHGGAPISFAIGGGQLIPGFDAGTAGMQVGETRIIEIPPSQGYGSTANSMIPANSTLIFLVTLESIS